LTILRLYHSDERSRQLVARLKDAVDQYHWPALVESNVKFAMHVVQEALDREASKDVSATRCISSYMVMRRETIGARPCFVLMQSTRRLYLPEHVLQHPIVAEMENCALDMVYIANVRLFRYLRSSADVVLTACSVASGYLFL
jgi:hypothetical protein